jgi:F-type H+-transporting ATPase subunit b
MLFDWFTIGAQILNFVVLVWLMKHFLYRPILHAIDAREKLIADELASAKATKADAQKEHDEFLKKNQDYDKRSAALLAQAAAAAKVEGEKFIENAKKDSETLSLKLHESLQNEEQSLHQAIVQRAQDEIFLIARKTLSDLAGLNVEQCIVDVFNHRLKELNEKEKELLISNARVTNSPMIVRTAFNLLPAQQTTTEACIKEIFGNQVKIQFEVLPGLISGIVLFFNEKKITWCIDDYLGSLQSAVKDVLQEKKKPEIKAVSKSAAPSKEPVNEHKT